MMYNTRYLPENFEQRKLEKTILRHFPYNLNVRSRWAAFIQDGRKNHDSTYCFTGSEPFWSQFKSYISKDTSNCQVQQ